MRTPDAGDDASGRRSTWARTVVPVSAGAVTGLVGAQVLPDHGPLVVIAVAVVGLALSLVAHRWSRVR